MKVNGILAVIVGLLGLNAEAATQITLNSAADDTIGQGQTYSFDSVNDNITLDAKRAYLKAETRSANGNFILEFSSPDGELFSAAYYPNARRHAPPSAFPGLLVVEETRGCNEVSGHLIVHEYDFSDETTPKIALDFEQYCAGSSAALNGTVRINSSIATPYNPPIAYAGRDIMVKEGSAVTLDGSGSFRADSTPITAHLWSQISGPDVMADATTNAAALDITTPTELDLGGTELVFNLQVTDQAGNTANDQVSVFVKSKSDPFTLITLTSPAGDYIGNGGNWAFDPTNALINVSRNGSQGVQIEIKGDNLWVANFAAANNTELDADDTIYTPVERFPDQSINTPGMHITRDGRQCATLTGQFTIKQLQWDGDTLERFWATFSQDCNASGNPLSGEIQFNTLDTQVPIIKTETELAVDEGTRVTLDGTQSYDESGSIVRYEWRQTAPGTPVTLNRPTFALANFDVHTLPDAVRREFLTFDFEIEDNLGYLARQTVTVEIQQNNTPPITVEERLTLTSKETVTIDLIANDRDSDGTIRPDSVRIFNKPPNGRVKLNGDGSVDYTFAPPEGTTLKDLIDRAKKNEDTPEQQRARDRFSYTIRDNDNAKSELGWVTVYLDEIPLEEEKEKESGKKNPEPIQGAGTNGLLTLALLILAGLFGRAGNRPQHRRKIVKDTV